MQIIKLDQTKDTPSIHFNLAKNIFEIKGKSMPENATVFFKPIYEWIALFSSHHADNGIQLNVDLEYLNSSSIKLVFLIFNQLDDYYNNTSAKEKTCINWSYKKDDDLIIMKGEEFKDLLDIPFNLIAKI